MTTVGEGDVKAVMDQSFPHHPLANAGFLKQLDGGPLQQPRADAGLYVLPRLTLQYDRVDACPTQQLRQQQPRGSGTDDRHLGRAHDESVYSPAAAALGPAALRLVCTEEAARAWRRSASMSCACTSVGRQSRRMVSPIERVTGPNGWGKAISCPLSSSWWIWCSDSSMTRSLASSIERAATRELHSIGATRRCASNRPTSASKCRRSGESRRGAIQGNFASAARAGAPPPTSGC